MRNTLKAYYIDPILQFVAEVDFAGDYKQIYKWIDATTFDVVNLNSYGDGLYVDDEGLLKEYNYYYSLPVYHFNEDTSNGRMGEYLLQTYAGKSLILGVDSKGDSDDVKGLKFALLKDRIQWHGKISRAKFINIQGDR
tara:strand:+ start:379 stop:792 length:414 start_codon:yes stop_codon:yes gene_type:complete